MARRASAVSTTSSKSAFHGTNVDIVMAGRLSDLPPLSNSTVRIYVCCGHTDFQLERRGLWNDTLPDLQRHFIAQGLDVLLIDLHSNESVDHAFDSHTFQTHLANITHSHQCSIGPFFLCLLGNKFSPVPLPLFIDEQEYGQIRNKAIELGQDIKILDSWYQLDNNSTPSVYVLQPIQSKYGKIVKRAARNTSEHDVALHDWISEHDQLVQILKKTLTASLQAGVISKLPRYLNSAVEQELQRALSLSSSRYIVINRNLEGVRPEDPSAGSYINVTPGQTLDDEAHQSMKGLQEMLGTTANQDAMHTFYLKWHPKGILPSTVHSHADYFDNFQIVVSTHFTAMIEDHLNTLAPVKNCREEKRALYQELLTHFHYCLRNINKCKARGFESIEERMKLALITGSKNEHKAMVVCGREGSGKTSLVSRMAQAAVNLLGKNTCLLVRYIGLTRCAMTLYDLLRSICIQLHHVIKDEPPPNAFTDIRSLVTHFEGLLKVCSNLSQNVVIIVDGVDFLKPFYHEIDQKISWILSPLPPMIHLIVTVNSTSKSQDTVLSKLRNHLISKDAFFELEALDDGDIQHIVDDLLSQQKRSLTGPQNTALCNTIRQQPVPLFVNLLLEEALQWSSSKNIQCGSDLPDSIESLVNSRLKMVEDIYGETVTSRMLRYLCSAHHGLSEMELLDLLSCNNDVIQEVLTPLELQAGLIRFPASIWLHVRKLLGSILEEVRVDQKSLICWSHRVFALVASQRYRIKTEEIKQSHRDIAELFLETWVGNKPMVVPEKDIQIIDNGCRFVCPQPLLYSETQYNQRRINELWYQLLNAGEIAHFKEHSFCNFEYLLAKLHSTSVQNLIQDLEMTFIHCLDAELILVLNSITQAKKILFQDPLQLASEVIGRLRQIKDEYPDHISPLVQQAMEWCDSFTLPILVPLSSWLPDPRTYLVTTLKIPDGVSKLCTTYNGQHLFCATPKNTIKMYHLPSKTLIRTLSGHRGAVTCLEMSHSNRFLLSGSVDCSLRMWDVSTGKNSQMYKEHDNGITCLAIAHSDQFVVTASEDHYFKMISLTSGEVIHSIKEHTAAVTCVVLNKADSMLVTASADRSMKVWYTDDMSLLNTINEGIESPIISLGLSVDNTFLIIGCEDASLHVRSFTTGSEVHALQGHKGKVETLAIGDDCQHCVAGCTDGNVYIFNLRTTELLDTLNDHQGAVSSVRVTRDGHFIYSAVKNMVHVSTFFKRVTHNILTDEHSAEMTCMAISKDGKSCITGSKDKMLKVWNLDISDFSENLEGHDDAITCVAVAADEAFVVSGSEDKTVKVWSLIMGCVITNYTAHVSPIRSVFIFSDNARVMSAEQADFIHVWRAEDGESLLSLIGPVDLLQIAPNCQMGISGTSDDFNLKIWSVTDGELIQTISHADRITCITYSSDSQYLVTGSLDNSLKVWEAPTGKLTQVLVEHDAAVKCATITESNRFVLSGSEDKRLLVWGLSTGAAERQLLGHTGAVTCVRITEDSSTAISGSSDHTLRVWNINHGVCLTLFDMHAAVVDLLITHDAGHVVVRLKNSCRVPLMCLHNSPAGDVKSQSQISIQLRDSPMLPLRPRPILSHHPPSLPRPKRSTKEKRSSISSVPDIITVSPMRAPMKKAIEGQKQNKETRGQRANMKKTKEQKKEDCNSKKSGVCVLL